MLRGGDLANMEGERFDIKTGGKAPLIQVPGDKLTVLADFKRTCPSDSYITEIKVMGHWLQKSVKITPAEHTLLVTVDGKPYKEPSHYRSAQDQHLLQKPSDYPTKDEVSFIRVQSSKEHKSVPISEYKPQALFTQPISLPGEGGKITIDTAYVYKIAA